MKIGKNANLDFVILFQIWLRVPFAPEGIKETYETDRIIEQDCRFQSTVHYDWRIEVLMEGAAWVSRSGGKPTTFLY